MFLLLDGGWRRSPNLEPSSLIHQARGDEWARGQNERAGLGADLHLNHEGAIWCINIYKLLICQSIFCFGTIVWRIQEKNWVAHYNFSYVYECLFVLKPLCINCYEKFRKTMLLGINDFDFEGVTLITTETHLLTRLLFLFSL